MSYIALARKWRPKTFSELVGQNHLTKALINSLDKNKLHHAYLFTGTRGVGKTSVARLFAKALNCEQGISSNPCLTCATCQSIEQGCFIDLLEIDGASKTRVEDTRDLLENVQYAPTNGRFKIYLIDEVHMLSTHSFNALLKTLEEPPAHVKFLLATTDPQKLPVTVLSRCLQFNLNHLSASVIEKQLQLILSHEEIQYESEALKILADAARGSMRDALSLLDQAIASSDGTICAKDVKESLGFTQKDYALQILQALSAKDPQQLIQISRYIAEESGNFIYVLTELLKNLHNMALAKELPHDSFFISISEEIMAIQNQFSAEDIQLLYQIALKSTEDIHLAPTMDIGFEMAILRMYTFRPSLKPLSLADLKLSVTLDNTPQVKPDAVSEIKYQSTAVDPQKKSTEDLQELNTLKTDNLAFVEDNKEQASKVIAEHTITQDTKDESSWSNILPKLKLTGLALSAAENAELASKTKGQVSLRISNSHSSIFTPSAIKRIEEALGVYYNEPICVTIESDEKEIFSPALEKKLHQSKQHQSAETALLQDPFFQQLQDEFSAQLLENSISILKDEL